MNENKENKMVSLIFATCNEYSFLWPGFFYYLEKYWPSFNYPIISTASTKIETHYDVSCTYSKNQSFSSRLINALKQCKTDIVLLTLDDFYLTKPVNESFFNTALDIMLNSKKVKCITLVDSPSSKDIGKRNYNDLFVVKKNTYHYSVTAQMSLWNRKYLLKILHHGESAWDFEYMGSIRNRFYNPVILYRKDEYKNAFSYPHGGVLQGGHWRINNKETLDIMNHLGISNPNPLPPDIINSFAKNNFPFWKRMMKKVYVFLSIIFPNIHYIL